MQVTEKTIQKLIYRNMGSGVLLPNVYIGENEVDALHISNSGYCTFYEIKLSRIDFFQEMKKKRHTQLLERQSDGLLVLPVKFYFVTYGFDLSHDEIPEYAGWFKLLEPDRLEKVEKKRAPKLWHEKISDEQMLKIYQKSIKRYSSLYHD